MLWTQRYSVGLRMTKWTVCLVVVLLESLVAFSWWEATQVQALLTLLVLAGLAFFATSSFRRERESGLLELLLVTPLHTWQVVLSRLVSLWLQFLPALAIVLSCWIIVDPYSGWNPFRQGGVHPEFGLIATTYVTLPCIGLFFSLSRVNTVAGWLLTLGVGIVLPYLAQEFLPGFTLPHSGQESWVPATVQVVLAFAATAWLCLRLRPMVASGLKR